ncbi:MAG: M1 family aminopeptidase, partial [Thermodesulfobacteriota bacterium]
RFPFILHSSYPHEILHNWWGNSVYIDFPKGNWAEGLTAYLADHRIKKQRGIANEFRRNVLQKYMDFVREGKDFPITEFRSRHSSATKAVGYGKTLMFFHMLRLQVGDDAFFKALQTFYRDNKFKRASFADIRDAFEKVVGYSLKVEFDQWIRRTGAPELLISNVDIESKGDKYILNLSIKQVQAGPAYKIYLPIVVYMKDREEPFHARLSMNDKLLKTSLKLDAAPLRIDVDPEFDVFRRLDRNEIPPAFSKAFGSDKVVIVLPASADKRLLQAYKQLGESWAESQTGQIVIKLDNELAELPPDSTIWLLGWKNSFLNKAIDKLKEYDVTLTDIGVQIGRENVKKDNNSIVLTAHNPSNTNFSLSWIATDNPAAIPGLGRKLPHYGVYSFLAFEGDEPSNILKGQWPTLNSPMSVLIE